MKWEICVRLTPWVNVCIGRSDTCGAGAYTVSLLEFYQYWLAESSESRHKIGICEICASECVHCRERWHLWLWCLSSLEFYPYAWLAESSESRRKIVDGCKWMCTERKVTPVALVLVVTSSRSDNTCCSCWSLQFWHSSTVCTSTIASTNSLTPSPAWFQVLTFSWDKSTVSDGPPYSRLLLLPAFTVELFSETRRLTWVLRLV